MKIFRLLIAMFLLFAQLPLSANISSQVNRTGPYLASSLPATLAVVFPYQQSSDLVVLDLGANGTGNDPAVILTLNSDYTVTGGGYNSVNNMQSGNVVVVTGGAHNVQAGDVIVILRNVPVNQLTYFPAGGILTGAMIEKALDKGATISQQLTETTGRALRFEPGETIDGTLLRSARAGKTLGFDANGNISYGTGGGGGGGTTYTAGTGLLLASNQFSVNPAQSLTTLTVSGGITGALTGNASTATALATARNINGVAFDGTAAITVPAAAGTLTGTALASNVVTSSLTGVAAGTIGSMAVQNASGVAITGGSITGATVTGLAAPAANSDAANKAYVDSISAGITPRTPVVVATTANITLSAPQTIDGQAVIAGNRVLVKNQTAPAENGIYDVAAGAWSRSTDSNTAAELLFGYYYFVAAGTTQGATSWFIQTPPTNLGTDPVVFAQFSASQNYSAGTGLGLAGNVFSLNAAQSGLTLTSSAFNGTVGATTPNTIAGTAQTITGNSYLGNLVAKANQLNESATNATASLFLNYDGYSGGTTQFRDTEVYDGKNTRVAKFTGSTKTLTLDGPLTAGANSITGGAISGTDIRIPLDDAFVQFWDTANTTRTGYIRFLKNNSINIVSESSIPINFVTGGSTVGALTTTGFQGVIGATTPAAGSFTTLSATSNVKISTNNVYLQGVTTAAAAQNLLGIGGDDNTYVFCKPAKKVTVYGTATIADFSDTGLAVTGGLQQTNVFNVRNYGAAGNNSANDTSFIANAAAAAIAAHGLLYFPPGTYLTDAISISGASGLTIAGDGKGVSVIKQRNPGHVLVVASSDHVNTYGLTFDGSCTTRTAGAQAVQYDASSSSFCDNEIINSGEYAFFAGSGSTQIYNLTVSRNLVRACYADGINFQYVTRSIIEGNTVDGADDDCIALGYNGSGVSTYINVVGNFCRARTDLGTTWGRGILLERVTDCTVVGNLIDTIKQTGIFLNNASGARPSRNHIIGNTIRNAAVNSGHGICAYATTDCELVDNVVINPAQGSGIELADWQNLLVQGGSITQNVNVFGRGIHCDESAGWAASWDNLRISGVAINMTGASTNSCVYLNPDSSVTMNTLVVNGVTGRQVVAGDYITIGSARTGTKAVIANNITLTASRTINVTTGGVFTVTNNN